MHAPLRDLASVEVWEKSLERSRRRRVLAAQGRREMARRKQASAAVSAGRSFMRPRNDSLEVPLFSVTQASARRRGRARNAVRTGRGTRMIVGADGTRGQPRSEQAAAPLDSRGRQHGR